MKVLVVSSSFYPKIDGSTRCVYDHARRLASSGDDVYLATRGMPGIPRSETIEGIKVRRSSYSFRETSLPNKAALIVEQMINIFRLQRKFRFSVIHVHGYVSGLAALPSKYLFRVPVVITTHGTEFLWPRDLWWRTPNQLKLELIFERFVLKNCDIVIAQSEGVERYMIELYGSGIKGKIRIVPTGVDQTKFVAVARTRLSKQVLFVGALSEIKGVSCLLSAFALAHDKYPSSRLRLVGSGPMAKKYKDWVRERHLESSVDFVGPVRDDTKLLSMYEGSDIVVLPSNVGGPVSCTIMEGLSCGRAVISTDVPGGIPDILGGGVGLLMRRGDEAQLASMLEELMADDSFLTELGENARRTVEEKYTLDLMVGQLQAVYGEIAG
ncbi:MAG: glycosyltransferase family 4 protein [Thaumarchaeota archaeon]|nr:glycosyltransferase family 4 protein [Nitrososphaerota archaeon]